MGSSSRNWKSSLLDEVTRQFGQARATADFAQIEHMAKMLSLLDGWSPANYPDPVDSDADEPRVAPVNANN